jgi:hypothetical protein
LATLRLLLARDRSTSDLENQDGRIAVEEFFYCVVRVLDWISMDLDCASKAAATLGFVAPAILAHWVKYGGATRELGYRYQLSANWSSGDACRRRRRRTEWISEEQVRSEGVEFRIRLISSPFPLSPVCIFIPLFSYKTP